LDTLEVENKKLKDKEEYINNEKAKVENQEKINSKTIQIKNEEIKIFLNSENYGNNSDKTINEEILYNIAKDLKEKEELKLDKENLENINKENESKIKTFKVKIQELSFAFAKSTLTKMLKKRRYNK